jgi:methyl-accepting chemotaxis protein
MVAGLNRLMDTSSHALADLGQLLAAVARGDLNQSIEAEYQGMLGQIRDDANRTVRQLKQVIGEISSASESIHVAASEIAAGNLDLSSRTEEQAASLEETAASMEQQTATVRETAANVREADHLAQGVATIASRAASEVTTVVANMSEIAASSERIAGISSLIDGIAFQTNILALNAAVEAARAGVEGRGFAVVAAEIRTLAQRSGEAAKQIKSLIEEETAHVQSGCASATGAEQAMVEVAQAIGRVTELLAEMNLAAGQQAEGIDQVNTAISQMDQVTQQNAALVEEAAAASQSLREQADGLKASIAVFAADACTIVAAAPTVLPGSGQRPKGAPSPRLAARPPKRLSA